MLGMMLNIARVLANPARVLKRVLRAVPGLPIRWRLDLDLYDRPAYAYGIARAAAQAKALGIPAITVVEFGVASGSGLLAMERIAADVEHATGVSVTPVGFDTGGGLPEPADYRDLPYLYRGGFYPMDIGALREKLKKAQLILGDVRETVPEFLERVTTKPLGFVSIDLDYYSSTRDALEIFGGATGGYLPRVLVYLDDIANEKAIQTRFTGELLAVHEFNERHQSMKIDKVYGLGWSRSIPAPWNDQMYAWHHFAHPLYDRPVVEEAASYVAPLR